MTQETVELARDVLAALGARDQARLIALSDPAVEWHSFFALSEEGAYRGHDGIERYMRDLADAWAIARAEVDGGLAVDNVAVLVGRLHYRGKGSGVESSAPTGWMLTFRDQKLRCFRAFSDPARALESLGLAE